LSTSIMQRVFTQKLAFLMGNFDLVKKLFRAARHKFSNTLGKKSSEILDTAKQISNGKLALHRPAGWLAILERTFQSAFATCGDSASQALCRQLHPDFIPMLTPFA
jgi:hypothetical protein